MDLCLTGRHDGRRGGGASRPRRARRAAGDLLDEALKAADQIAGLSLPAVMMTKESVNRAFEATLAEGLRFERRLFHSLFATEDQKEGMAAFVEQAQAAVQEPLRRRPPADTSRGRQVRR